MSSNGSFNQKVACSAGVLSVQANVISLWSFIQQAMFDLQLEWTVGVGDGEREKRGMSYAFWLVALHCISGNRKIINKNEFI